MGETSSLYVGDEQGALSIYKIERSTAIPKAGNGGGSSTITFSPWRRKANAHAFGIERLVLVPAEALLISTG